MTALGAPDSNRSVESTLHEAPEYNEHGYDMRRCTRYIYAFLTEDGTQLTVGLVNRENRLARRLIEVTKSSDVPGLSRVAYVAIEHIDGHEAEDVEAAVRLWMNRAKGFRHAGAVDWLVVPDGGVVDWQSLLDQATEAIKSIASIAVVSS